MYIVQYVPFNDLMATSHDAANELLLNSVPLYTIPNSPSKETLLIYIVACIYLLQVLL